VSRLRAEFLLIPTPAFRIGLAHEAGSGTLSSWFGRRLGSSGRTHQENPAGLV
jgi:hypothetical protein